MSLRNMFETTDYSKETLINIILKNKYFTKNVVTFDEELYFELSDVKGAIRLAKKLGKIVGYGEILSASGGKIGYFDSYISAIMGKEAKAYIKITFVEGIIKDLIYLTDAKILSDTEYKLNHKKIIEKL